MFIVMRIFMSGLHGSVLTSVGPGDKYWHTLAHIGTHRRVLASVGEQVCTLVQGLSVIRAHAAHEK